jgi:hypothetical protein
MKFGSLVLLIALLAAGAQAQTSAPSPEVQGARKACRADAHKLCPGKRGMEAAACLRSNSDKISPDCKSALTKLPPPPNS